MATDTAELAAMTETELVDAEAGPERAAPPADEAPGVPVVSGGLLKALRACGASEKGRYALNGILFEGNTMVAADGARLAAVELTHYQGDAAPPWAGIFETPKLRAKPCALDTDGRLTVRELDYKPSQTPPDVTPDDIAGHEASRSYGEAIEGQFPNWREVIPNGPGIAHVAFSPDLMRGLLDLALQTVSYNCNVVDLTIYGERAPMRLDAENLSSGVKATMVLSPVIREEAEVGSPGTQRRKRAGTARRQLVRWLRILRKRGHGTFRIQPASGGHIIECRRCKGYVLVGRPGQRPYWTGYSRRHHSMGRCVSWLHYDD